MGENENVKKTRISAVNIMVCLAAILLIFTILSARLLSGIYAKYRVSDQWYDAARVASAGIGTLELREHKAQETRKNSGIYKLLTDEAPVQENEYEKVLPGVDIPKDPYIKLELHDAEVSYELYVQVTESKNFPENVTYTVRTDWEKVVELSDEENGVYVYKYKDTFAPLADLREDKIEILENNKIYVGEHFVGDGPFSLTFSAYIKQVKTS